MSDALRIILPLYFLVYFGFAFLLKSAMVAKRIGKNPLVMPKDDSAFGLVGRYFKLTLAGIFLYVLAYGFFPGWHGCFLPINGLDKSWIVYTGLGLLFFALIWTVIAQNHMRDSWRIGIDTETRTELITGGLFRYSRNPIFFGMILSLCGLFLATSNAFTLLFLVAGYMLIQIQIRLEEEFLEKQHGEEYMAYKNRVKRII